LHYPGGVVCLGVRTPHAAVTGLVFVAGVAHAQFYAVGVPAGQQSTRVYGLSADGGTAAGSSFGNLPIGYSWTPSGGRQDFNFPVWTSV